MFGRSRWGVNRLKLIDGMEKKKKCQILNLLMFILSWKKKKCTFTLSLINHKTKSNSWHLHSHESLLWVFQRQRAPPHCLINTKLLTVAVKQTFPTHKTSPTPTPTTGHKLSITKCYFVASVNDSLSARPHSFWLTVSVEQKQSHFPP